MTASTQTESLEARAEKRLAELHTRRASRKELVDLPGTMTQRERQTYADETVRLTQDDETLRAAVAEVSSFRDVDLDERWVFDQKRRREQIDAELATFTMPVRGEMKKREEHLGWCLKLIDRGFSIAPPSMPIVDLGSTRIGELMAAHGLPTSGEALQRLWRGGIAEVERRIKLRRAERDKAVAKLERLLLSDEERQQRDAEDAKFRAALGSMRMQNNTKGDGLVAFTLNGDPLPLDAMTADQRTAFERFERAAFPPRETVTS